jgi:CheY-like chemotaxis protein
MSGYRFDKLRVLVVDDSAHMRKLVAEVLRAFGVVNVVESPDAERAWAMLREFSPDVLILDWQMDGMTGIELVEKIRTAGDSPNPFIPIIMLTGYTQLERVREARDVGVNEFLAKPVSVKGILTRLISVIENPRPFVRTKDYFGPCRRRRTDEYRGPERRSTAVELDVPDLKEAV